MSRLTEREIARRLAEPLDDGPPEGLLEKLKAEIPPTVRAGTAPVEGKVVPFARETGALRRRRWLAAASVAVAMTGAVLAWRVLETGSRPGLESAGGGEMREAAAPREPAAEEAPWQAPSLPSAPAPRRQEAPAPQEASEKASKAEREAPSTPSYVAPPPPPPPPASRVRAEASAAPEPAAPLQVQESSADRLTATVESPVVDPRRTSTGTTAIQKEGDAAGGAAGGIVGGVVGGVPGAVLLRDSRAKKTATTGGDAEPNDEPYGDVFYRSAGVNPFVDTEEDARSTFGLDVDTASYTVARRYLRDGNLPDPDSVRVEEFVNFFDYGDEPPARGDFALRAEGAPTPFAPETHRLLRFSVKARQIRPEDRRPAVLTFVVDVSGSMDMENRLGLVKSSLKMLLERLRPADKVGLVVYGSEARVVLEPTHDLARVAAAVEALRTDGATNAEAGLLLAYDLANRYFRPEANNRLVLCSDGVANVGVTGPDSILERIGREARKGIELTTLGFGMGNYNDHLMEQLANRGDGRYAYLDTQEEAHRVLVEELEGTLETVARDAKVQVVFNPEVVERWRLLGYENRDIADEKFRDDTVDAGEIGAGHAVTALYEVKLRPGAVGHAAVANLHLRWRSEATGRVQEEEKMLRLSQLARSWERATPALRLASVVAELAEILRGSYWSRGSSLEALAGRARQLAGALAGNRRAADLSELADLIGRAARLRGE